MTRVFEVLNPYAGKQISKPEGLRRISEILGPAEANPKFKVPSADVARAIQEVAAARPPADPASVF